MILDNQLRTMELVLGSAAKDRSSGTSEEDKLDQEDQRIKIMELDALEEGTEGNGSNARLFIGQSVRSGIESANRQVRETTSRQSGGDVLSGDAQSSDKAGELNQQARGAISFGDDISRIDYSRTDNTSTHELMGRWVASAPRLIGLPGL
jgi:hypothetical protein